MSKKFQIAGNCVPELNYMVDITSRLDEISEMIDQGMYFTINRARQFGKTTIMRLLKKHLADKYEVWGLSFEGLSDKTYEDEDIFVRDFLEDILLPKVKDDFITVQHIHSILDSPKPTRVTKLGTLFKKICKSHGRKIVMMIDEVDQACNNQVFLDFLGILRNMYLERSDNEPAFQSVILAGVYDIKNIKLKMRNEKDHRYNSPWNIADEFKVDLSFSPADIATMLKQYEEDYNLGIDIEWFSTQIYAYTAGYPFLVSYICKLLDEDVWKEYEFGSKRTAWTPAGFQRAVNLVLSKKSTLFEDMIKKLTDFPDLRRLIQTILLQGIEPSANIYNHDIQLGIMFGFLKEQDGKVIVANRIFETHIYNWIISENKTNSLIFKQGDAEKYTFIKDGTLDMDRILERFKVHYDTIYSGRDIEFLEREGRFMFLTFLKPIINGVGNYYIESETRDQKRTDVIVDYQGKQFLIELKIWHGEEYQDKGRKQLCDYLDIYHQQKGWLVSFCFNQKKKDAGIRIQEEAGKIIAEVVI